MTRQHVSAHRPPEDPYAHARCVNCPHFVSAGDPPGRDCQYKPDGCGCTDHRVATEGGK